MNGVFKDLEDQVFFAKYVTNHFREAPRVVIEDFPCDHEIDSERVTYAHGEYIQNIKQFAVLLHSENPDHYKRSGAMLHALYKSGIVTSVNFGPSIYGTLEEIESGPVLGISYADGAHMLRFPVFYREFHNEILSFDLAYQLCYAYEDAPTIYGFNYLHNVSHYLKNNRDLTVDSLSMLFRSLMLK